MSKDSVKNFYEFLKQDASAVEELKKAAEKATEAIIAFAAEKGFDFDEKDIAAYEECVQKELSLDELERSMPVPGDFVYCSGSAGVTPKEAAGIGAE